MKIALIGASGFIGSALRQEALQRGHDVTALVSNPAKLTAAPHLTVVRADVTDTSALSQALAGHDLVISAFSGHAQEDVRGYYLKGIHSIIEAVRQAGVARLLLVGGAGSLEVAPGKQVLDDPAFPAAWKGSAEGARDALNLLRGIDDLNWTVLSPAAMIQPGQRTGTFRLGRDQLVANAQGKSEISVEDFAVAMLDEAETPKHPKQRFTLAY